MHKKRLFRTPFVALLGLLAMLVLPAAAQANHVDANASATCVYVGGVATATVTVKFIEFKQGDNPVNGTIMIGSTSYPVGPLTWNGTGEYTWSHAVTPGTFAVSGSFSWPTQGSLNGAFTGPAITCAAPPDTPPTTPPTTTGTPPGGGTLPGTVVSGIARLNGPSGCVKQAFTASVSGRSIAGVAFYVDGKLVKRIASERARYKVKVKPGRLGFGRHRVIARVTFLAESGTSARALPLTFRRCAQGAVQPRFTG